MTRDNRITKGKTANERLDNVERYLQHIKKRLVSRVGAITPPVPVSKYCNIPEEDGTIMRYMFPAQGEVITAALFIENWNTDSKRIQFIVDIMDQDQSSSSRVIDLKDQTSVFDADYQILPGSKFKLRLADPQENVSGIWAAFLYSIHPSKATVHYVLIDELEKEMNK